MRRYVDLGHRSRTNYMCRCVDLGHSSDVAIGLMESYQHNKDNVPFATASNQCENVGKEIQLGQLINLRKFAM